MHSKSQTLKSLPLINLVFIFSFNFQGHGKSFGGGELIINDFKEFHQTSWSFVNTIMKLNPKLEGLPIFFIGTSMGGSIILEMMLNKPYFFPEINGLIPVAAAIDVVDKPNQLIFNALYYLSYAIQSMPVQY
jgi:alpha-beta hydrolase superfamily lysophospholipase